MKYKLTNEKEKELKETFDFYDENKDGKLDLDEMRVILQQLGYDLCDDEI